MAAIGAIGLLSLMDAAVKQVATPCPPGRSCSCATCFRHRLRAAAVLAQQRRLPPMEVLRAHLLRSVAVVLTATTFFYALGACRLR